MFLKTQLAYKMADKVQKNISFTMKYNGSEVNTLALQQDILHWL